ncbi:hypothetical protein M426DRAFT_22153 [Hypoxylon sp. CI-4A]|nr:hypothetical protein M426DRAFT_22153 [Hypoxylon sp. CI-4A]
MGHAPVPESWVGKLCCDLPNIVAAGRNPVRLTAMDKPTLDNQVSGRNQMSRPRSSSNLLNAVHDSSISSMARDELRSASLGKLEVDNLRELASFLRSTGPPSNSSTFQKGRWSVKSIRKDSRVKTHAQSLSSLPSVVVPRKTIDGHRYLAMSVPAHSDSIPRVRSDPSLGVPPAQVSSHEIWPLMRSTSSITLSRLDGPGTLQSKTEDSIDEASNNCTPLIRAFTPGQIHIRTMDHVLSHGDQMTSEKVPTESDIGDSHINLATSCQRSESPTTILVKNQGLHCVTSSTPLASIKHLTQTTLAVPQDSLLPESPGFPKMLAAMTFPSPPAASRSPSPETNSVLATHEWGATHSSIVRPHASSQHTRTSDEIPIAPYYELLVQPRCLTVHSKEADVSLYPPSTPGNMPGGSISRPSSGTSSTSIGASHDSITSATGSSLNLKRQSSITNITTTTSPRQGSPANKACDTIKRDIDAISSASSMVKLPCFSYPLPITIPDHVSSMSDPNSIKDQVPVELGDHGSNETFNGSIMIDKPMDSATQDVDGRRSIIERRIARRTKVQAYKKRDLDAAKFGLKTNVTGPIAPESTDSPILGWFTDVSSPRKLASLEPTRTSQSPLNRRGSIGYVGDHNIYMGPAQTSVDLGSAEVANTTLGHRSGWTFSSIMTTETLPVQGTTGLPMATDEICMSPIMVVTSLNSGPGSRLSISSMNSLGSGHTPPSRQTLKRQLKIIPQPRPKSISTTIQRNLATGEIERTMSVDIKSNRLSLTAPLLSSPSLSSSLKRRSLGNNMPARSPPAWKPTSQLERTEWYDSDKYQSKTRRRALSVKERLHKEKQAREEEISKLVEQAVGRPGIRETRKLDDVKKSQGEDAARQIETRLQRLEENGDAWLRVVQVLLDKLSRTLEELREDGNKGKLTMSEFSTGVEAEAKRLSCNVSIPMASSPSPSAVNIQS